jgi:hypothetical protein
MMDLYFMSWHNLAIHFINDPVSAVSHAEIAEDDTEALSRGFQTRDVQREVEYGWTKSSGKGKVNENGGQSIYSRARCAWA